MKPPFNRTVCACAQCVQCCKEQPGFLVPGDAERIMAELGAQNARSYFWASPGAKVIDIRTGVIRSIGTITPRYENGKCVFLDENDRCKIHAVAPFGCAYADTHMDLREGNARSAWGIRQIEASAEYNKLRATLPVATHYKPRKY